MPLPSKGSLARKGLIFGLACTLLNTVADAQAPTTIDGILGQATPAPSTYAIGSPVSSDQMNLRLALAAARRSDRNAYQNAYDQISNPLARKIANWALVDAAGESLPFFEIDRARKDFDGWPRETRRQALAERTLETGGLGAQGTVDWFAGKPPATAYGAMALASAYLQLNRRAEAEALVRTTWRETVFEADVQRTFLARFSSMLTADDHAARTDFLLYGPQGPAAREMLSLLSDDQRALAEARIGVRAGNDAAVDKAPDSLRNHPGLVFERASAMRRRSNAEAALMFANNLGKAPGHDAGDTKVWVERRNLINAALKQGNYRAAYDLARDTGLRPGADFAEAEFYAGWLALRRLNDPKLADQHFARIQAAGTSPMTQSRALYWRGRAHEAQKDEAGAKGFYEQGAKYSTVFYGQLAAEKAGLTVNIGKDAEITDTDRIRFGGREQVQAAKYLLDAGERDLYRAFVTHLSTTLPSAGEQAQLVDLARGSGDQELSMRVVRNAAQRNYILPERGYPLRVVADTGGLELPLIFGITRQESGFDPKVRSGVGARGMMQLMPGTATIVARRLGVSYSPGMLDDPDYNMRLGGAYIEQMVEQFSGSYVLAIAAYNAGPGRPAAWVDFCGDPRTTTDPIDFIECIPFSETRNYVMRVMEGMQVYRARLNNGVLKPTMTADLRRGAYSYTASN